MMRKILITQRTKQCAGICGCYGVKGFLSIFGFDNINLASPDDHFPKLDFVFYFETWYDGCSGNAAIDEIENQPYTLLIVESPEFIIMAVTDELIPYDVFECYVWVIQFSIYGLFVSSCSFDSHVKIREEKNEVI